jgi:hypothetical protein
MTTATGFRVEISDEIRRSSAMTTTLRRTLLAIAIGVGLVVLGVLSGIAIDHMRFDRQRAAVLKPYEDALRRRNEVLMNVELATNGRHRSFEAAVARGHRQRPADGESGTRRGRLARRLWRRGEDGTLGHDDRRR